MKRNWAVGGATVATSYHISDLVVCRLRSLQNLLFTWTERAKVTERWQPSVEARSHFDNLYSLEEVPRALTEGTLSTPSVHGEAVFRETIRTWAATLSPVEEDQYGIIDEMHQLAIAHCRILETSNNHSKEHGQHFGIDLIISLAFSDRFDRHSKFKTEEAYHVVNLPRNPDAVSDTLVTIPSDRIEDQLHTLATTFEDPSVLDHLYWSSSGRFSRFSIIGFAGEFKKDDAESNKNQLIMVLVTAQSQRKALSLKKSIVMGATGCRGRVQIYSSYWNDDDTLHVYAHEPTFELADPIQVIRLWVFFSKLEKYLQGTFVQELSQWVTASETIVKSHMWRSPRAIPLPRTRSSDRTSAMTSTSDDVEGSRGGNGHAMIVDGLEDNHDDLIMKWRDGVAEVAEKAAAIFDEGEISSMERLSQLEEANAL